VEPVTSLLENTVTNVVEPVTADVEIVPLPAPASEPEAETPLEPISNEAPAAEVTSTDQVVVDESAAAEATTDEALSDEPVADTSAEEGVSDESVSDASAD